MPRVLTDSHHTMPKPMRDKIHHFWITSNDPFKKQFYLFSNQKLFRCFPSMIIYIQNSCVFYGAVNFRGPTAGFARLSTLLRPFIAGIMSTITKSFTQGGVYPYLLIPNTYFSLPFYSTVRLFWTSSNSTEPT